MSKPSTVVKKKISRPKKNVSSARKKDTAVPDSMADLEKKHGINLIEEAKRLEKSSPQERVAWALETFPGKIAMSSSFGAQSAVSLHMLTMQYPDIPVILVDTGYFFPETYRFIDELTERLKLNLKIYSNPLTPAWQEARFGKLWEDGVEGIEKYNDMNKVEPMNRALDELGIEALFSGLRRQQSSSRQSMPAVVSQRGRIKIHPIVDWTDMDVGQYLVENKLPYHPLWDEGYVSIGDWHTTRKLTDGMTVEETRFFGLKRECGLNEDVDFQI
ncbi:MAG: phosphoadenylyl-sulfate reductase [Verrucomicrobiales bacterium]|nr:phosphoadenylyl-sulfate reductase [Verrucomicrobiales bacterium]